MLDTKLISIQQHNDRQNGFIKDLQQESIKCRNHRSLMDRLAKQWKFILVIVLVGLYLFHSMVEIVSIRSIINLIF